MGYRSLIPTRINRSRLGVVVGVREGDVARLANEGQSKLALSAFLEDPREEVDALGLSGELTYSRYISRYIAARIRFMPTVIRGSFVERRPSFS